jgi:hypothetical protein
MALSDVSKAPAQLVLIGWPGPAGLALGGAVLAYHPTGPAFGDPEALLQDNSGPAAALRG